MSIDFYINATRKAVESSTDVKVGQRIQIQHKSEAGENDLELGEWEAEDDGG